MAYYKIIEGHQLDHPNGSIAGKSGEVIELATDSEDKSARKAAAAVLHGQWAKVVKVDGPSAGEYKTREMSAKPKKKAAKSED